MKEIEGNKLIAEFMGVKKLKDKDFYLFKPHFDGDNHLVYLDDLIYHTSWDWLMPVVEKIGQDEDLRGQIDLSINYFFEGDIKSVWLAVVEVISSNKKIKAMKYAGVTKFRKKPVVIEAVQYDGHNNPFNAIKKHKCDYRMCPLCGGDNQDHDYIETMHDGQSVVVKPGDWIIPDGKPNTFYPCKPNIFEKTYELESKPSTPQRAEEVKTIISSHLNNITYSSGKPKMDTAKCDEVAELILNDLESYRNQKEDDRIDKAIVDAFNAARQPAKGKGYVNYSEKQFESAEQYLLTLKQQP